MNLQQLKYVIAVAEAKSITKAARQLYISQPSLSNAIKDLEAETGVVIFVRSRTGVTLTKDGMEFLGYARQVLQQMELLEDKYITVQPGKTRFGVSTQHYTFTENAFVELVQRFGQERYEFYFNEAGTHQILEDVKNRISDLGIIYFSNENETVLRKVLEEYGLEFVPLFCANPHVFLQRNHPLAACSADCEDMWQIGVDVLPEYRRRGIACALTGALAKEIISREKVPFYCTAWSNIRSVRNALKSGFVPAWVEMTAKPAGIVDGMNL